MNGTLYDQPTFPSAKEENIPSPKTDPYEFYLGKTILIYTRNNIWKGTYKENNPHHIILKNPYNKVLYIIKKEAIECIEIQED